MQAQGGVGEKRDALLHLIKDKKPTGSRGHGTYTGGTPLALRTGFNSSTLPPHVAEKNLSQPDNKTSRPGRDGRRDVLAASCDSIVSKPKPPAASRRKIGTGAAERSALQWRCTWMSGHDFTPQATAKRQAHNNRRAIHTLNAATNCILTARDPFRLRIRGEQSELPSPVSSPRQTRITGRANDELANKTMTQRRNMSTAART